MSSKQGARPAPPNRQKPKPKPYAGNPQMQAVQEARREAAKRRQEVAQAAAQRRRRSALLRRIGIIAAVALVVLAGIGAYAWNEANKPGELVAMQLSPHLTKATDPHAPYTTDPPTSGPHLPTVPLWQVYDQPIDRELQVHALEDGGVVINYRPDLDKATVDRLAALARSYTSNVLMSPYPNLSNPIVLTAWRRIDRLNAFDEARIKRFIDAYKGVDHHKESGS